MPRQILASLMLLLMFSACGRDPAPGVGSADSGPPAPDAHSQPEVGPLPDARPDLPGTSDSGPCSGISWSCKPDPAGGNTCQMTGGNGGLPPGGAAWTCNLTTHQGMSTWFCHGSGTKPGGQTWDCESITDQPGRFRCRKLHSPCDRPPGGGAWACVKGSAFGGTRCSAYQKVNVHSPCTPGQRFWCDGLQYSGWGHATCGNDGRWRTKVVNGKKMLDCAEQSSGARPMTHCACYHFFYNPACCERPDCIVPPGSPGQLCPKSAGKLCSYCNPMKPECHAPGAKCVVTNAHESYCGALCSTDKDCPKAYTCMQIKLKVGTTRQCIPADYSCYY